MTEDWSIITTTPAVLADVPRVMPAVWRLRCANPRPAWRRRFVWLRWAELVRRFSPEDALRALEGLPQAEDPDVPHLCEASVRAAIHLEQGHPELAAPLVSQVPTLMGARDLLAGRVVWLEHDLVEALPHLERSVALAERSSHPLSLEVETEALGFLARLFDAMEASDRADATWERLERLCLAHGAALSRLVVRAQRAQGRARRGGRRLAALANVRRLLTQRYTQGHEALRERIAPIPLHVHGAAKAHKADPGAYAEAIVHMATLAWGEGDRQSAYETAWYGHAIGARVFGERGAEPLKRLVDLLLEPVEPALRPAYRWRMEHRAAQA